MFLNNFGCQTDVENEFELTHGELDGCKILIAAYNTGNWEGDAFVLFQREGKLYEVHASHCSCYGLSGMFDPEETSIEALEHYIAEGDWRHREYTEVLKEVILKLKKGNTVKKVTYFEATDGTKFDDEAECLKYEEVLMLTEALLNSDAVRDFTDEDNIGFFMNAIATWLLKNYTVDKL